jgi:hypothetical protein
MAGGLFAISKKFFFELGGYDEGLEIWGGEQYELSFKVYSYIFSCCFHYLWLIHLLFHAVNYLFHTIRYGSVVGRCLTPLVLESGIFTGNMLRFQIAPKAILSAGYVEFLFELTHTQTKQKRTDLLILRFLVWFQNYKRVAEVWMDEYKEYLYLRRPQYRNLEVGDLSAQNEIRERLQCKVVNHFHVLRLCNETLNFSCSYFSRSNGS